MESGKIMKRHKKYFWVAREEDNGLWSEMVHFFVNKPVLKRDRFGLYWQNRLKEEPIVDYLFEEKDFRRLGVKVRKGECKKIKMRRWKRGDNNRCVYMDFQIRCPGPVDYLPRLFVTFFDYKHKWIDIMPYYYFVEYTGISLSESEWVEIDKKSNYVGLMNNLLKLKMEEV